MSNEDILLDFLAKNKRNITQQRLDIAKRFLSMRGHHTLEEIYLAIREKSPKVGQSTVYRTIHLLRDAGLVREVLLEDGSMRYEAALGKEHHDHLICQQCGKIIEFLDNDVEALQSKIAERAGFRLLGHHMLLFGLCQDCQKKHTEHNT